MAKVDTVYEKLHAHMRKTSLLASCSSVLNWDKQTQMPQAGAQHRAEQLSELASLCHQRRSTTEVGEWLALCERSRFVKDATSAKAVNIREWRRDYNKSMDMPLRLVEELARVTALAHQHWALARKESDFSVFAPWLEKIVKLKREEAEALGYAKVPYDALLDDYEPGANVATIREIFEALRVELVPLVQAIREAPEQPDLTILQDEFPIKDQKRLARHIARAIGFNLDAGRIDTVLHPFCTGVGPGDTRITTRYNQKCFSDSFFGILHEAGHGLYCQGLPKEHYGTPAGQPVSLAIHESQSRLWENLVGRSLPFWRFADPLTRETFPDAFSGSSVEDVHHAVNAVRPSFIRVEADEVTYNLHIIMRFEIEEALISGDLPVRDLPEIWNSKFRELLGIEVEDDRHGCLQDVHWSFGGFGYFPAYCLGNIFAAQIFEAAREALPDLDASFAEGEFVPLRNWLLENVHARGMTYRSDRLIEEITGQPPSHEALLRHLRTKYSALYGMDKGV